MLRISTLLVIATLAMLATRTAEADWYFPLVRITCIPEARFAAVESFGLYNIGDAVTPVPKELETQGIFELRRLAEHPFTCQLPQGALLIEISNYHAPQPKGSCGAVEDADLTISLAGLELVKVRSTHGGCDGSQRHDIRISQYEIQHCVLRFKDAAQIVRPGDSTAVETTCKSTSLQR